MKVLFDTNVVLDLLLDREPFSADAASLMAKVERGELGGVLGATTVTTIHYLVARALDAQRAREHITSLLQFLDVAAVTRSVLEAAVALDFADFEDAVLHEAAREAGVDGIVTRNVKDFGGSLVRVYMPAELLVALDEQSSRFAD